MEGRLQLPRGTAVYRGNGKDWFQDKQYDLAIERYKKAISPGGSNGNAEKRMEKIEQIAGK